VKVWTGYIYLILLTMGSLKSWHFFVCMNDWLAFQEGLCFMECVTSVLIYTALGWLYHIQDAYNIFWCLTCLQQQLFPGIGSG